MLSLSEERVVYKAELNWNVDSENDHGGSSETYVLHRIGCSQEDHQLLRKRCERSGPPGRQDRSNTNRTGWLDKDCSEASCHRHGGDHLHRLDLRLPASACRTGEGGTPLDVARYRSSQEEK